MTKTRPIIGVTLDSEDAGGYASSPWYALRQNYCGSLAKAGGVPVALPHQPDLVFDYLDMVDGIVVTGGGFDISPEMFGQSGIHPTVRLKPGRTEFELALAREALKRDMPVLGICGGHQLLGISCWASFWARVSCSTFRMRSKTHWITIRDKSCTICSSERRATRCK